MQKPSPLENSLHYRFDMHKPWTILQCCFLWKLNHHFLSPSPGTLWTTWTSLVWRTVVVATARLGTVTTRQDESLPSTGSWVRPLMSYTLMTANTDHIHSIRMQVYTFQLITPLTSPQNPHPSAYNTLPSIYQPLTLYPCSLLNYTNNDCMQV